MNLNPIVITTTTAAAVMLPNNPRRKAFILSPLAAGTNGVISISTRQQVVAGQGVLNFIVVATFPTLIDDSIVGDQISTQWYVISENGGEVFEVLEVSYEPC